MDKDKIGMHSKKPFLLLQSRSEDEASDDEYQAFLKFGGLKPAELTRLRLDTGVRPQVALDDYAGVLMGGGAANFAYDDTQKSPEQREFEAYILPLIRHWAGERVLTIAKRSARLIFG